MCTRPRFVYIKDGVPQFMHPSTTLDKFNELKNKSIVNQNRYYSIPCGKCIECLISYHKNWTLRCMLESKLYEKNCFITLTYANTDGFLCRKDIQLFIKRLRKKFSDIKIRYFGCGEYGSKGLRPHFHLLLFNFDFDDKYLYKLSKRGERLFRSPTLEKLWPFGFSSIGDVNENSVRYCSKYMQKFNNIPEDFISYDTGEIIEATKPFNFMSLKPGIGLNYFLANFDGTNDIFLHGFKYTIPRYFLTKLSDSDFIKIKNKKKILSEFYYSNPEDLYLRERLQEKKLKLFSN